MQKKFIINLAILLVLNLLIKPFWILGIDRAVQNEVQPGEYGLYYALFNFSFLFNILLDFGITNFNNRNIAQNQHLLSKHVPSIVLLRLLLGLLYMAGSLIVALIIGYRSYTIWLIVMMGFNQFLASFILYLRSNLAGLHLFISDSILSVLDRLIMILFCAILLWGGIRNEGSPFRIEWYIYSQTVAYFITCLIALVLVFEKSGMASLRWNPAFFMVILRKSYPYGILVLLMTFYNRADAVMLERILPDGKVQASVYASAYRLLDASNMIAFLFAGLLLPLFSRMLKQRDNIEQLVRLSFSMLICLSFTTAAVCWFFSDTIIGLLYHNHVDESASVLSVLMACFIFVSITYVFGTLLTANGNLRMLNTMAGLGMAMNIGLNFLLIPKYKALGTAYSSLITQSVTALVQVYLAYRVFHFQVNKPFLIRLFLFLLAVAVSGALIQASAIKPLLGILLLAFVSPVAAVATGMLSPGRLIKVLREPEN